MTVPPFSMNARMMRQRSFGADRADLIAVFGGKVRRCRRSAASARAAASSRSPTAARARAARPAADRRRNPAFDEDQRVVLRVQVAGVELWREHPIERELELFQDPARPAGVHRPAILIPEADRADA